MPGVGTKMAITKNSAPARCLDLTRLISRVGRGPMTGIDRVEFEYLHHLLKLDAPLFGLVRVRPGFALLDRSGVQAVFDRLTGRENWGGLDFIAAVSFRAPDGPRRAAADIRRLAVAICSRRGLAVELQRHLPAGVTYLNVGHSNLSDAVFAAIKTLPSSQITVMIHDTIPLDLPQFQKPETVIALREKLKSVSKYADLILTISQDSHQAILGHLSTSGRMPEICVVPIGVRQTAPAGSDIPAEVTVTTPYFVALGTIEPRKNHSLLLDIWDIFAESEHAPNLIVIGQRGWNNDAVFVRLDRHPRHVTELNTLSDAGVAAIMAGANGLLMPSFAEGFGLPVAEALAADLPVICNDLPVFRELFGNYPIYADVTDMYLWKKEIEKLAVEGKDPGGKRHKSKVEMKPFTWDDHFNLALNRT